MNVLICIAQDGKKWSGRKPLGFLMLKIYLLVKMNYLPQWTLPDLLIFQHMRDVAERRQQLELQHEKALQALQKKKDEVRQLQQVTSVKRRLLSSGFIHTSLILPSAEGPHMNV